MRGWRDQKETRTARLVVGTQGGFYGQWIHDLQPRKKRKKGRRRERKSENRRRDVPNALYAV